MNKTPAIALALVAAAAAAGVRAGDVSEAVDGGRVSSLAAFARAMDRRGQRVMSVARGEDTVRITLP